MQNQNRERKGRSYTGGHLKRKYDVKSPSESACDVLRPVEQKTGHRWHQEDSLRIQNSLSASEEDRGDQASPCHIDEDHLQLQYY
jgi:hypothetical protein